MLGWHRHVEEWCWHRRMLGRGNPFKVKMRIKLGFADKTTTISGIQVRQRSSWGVPTRPRHTAEDKGVKSTKFLLKAICNMWAHLHQVTRWVRNGSRQLCCTRKAASQRLCRDSSNNSGRSRSLRILLAMLSSKGGQSVCHWSLHSWYTVKMQVKAPRQVLAKTSLASSLSNPSCFSARTLV